MHETDQTSESVNPSEKQWAETMADAPEFNDGEKTEDSEALHEQEIIADADVDFAEALSRVIPQVGEDGKANYYLCGSVAMDLLPRVRKLETFYQQGRKGEPEKQGEIELSDTARTEFLKGVRKKGHDIDIVRTRRTDTTANVQTVADQCKNPESIDLISEEKHKASDPLQFDYVAEVQGQQEYFYSKAILDDGETIYIASPGALIGAKAVDYIMANTTGVFYANALAIATQHLDTPEKIEEFNRRSVQKRAEGIEKRKKDLKALVAGFSKVMSREEIINSSRTAIMHRLQEELEDYEESERDKALETKIAQLEAVITECLEDDT